ncbi:MAG TPA: mannitol dehydrogenase family protein [Ramlibacter sp.]|uniref:mannitol dehydrogenase family protein n=1 Tax=Ramlibacter sp. TaxID=1917967 RepID=UPI002ED3EA5F
MSALAARNVSIPKYPRDGAPGVVHLGLGAFHRAHQALVYDRLLRDGDGRWGVFGVAMRSTAVVDALVPQDHLYTVQVASQSGVFWQLGAAIWETSIAAREPQQVAAAIAAPSTRWLTLTVTEKGYTPELAALVVQGLAARRAAGLGGLTVASCDNLSRNGRKLQALCEAATPDASLVQWMREACTFPDSMVDRIVPAATPATIAAAETALGVGDASALATEAFWEWVIEGRFVDPADGRLLAAAGVTVVDEVAPFEEAKLRMLNGSHTAMACLGAVAGLPFISDCVGVPAIRAFVHGLMTHEVGPHVSRSDWPAYRDALLTRFANPQLKHSVHQIATDSSQKIPQRWPASIEGGLRQGRMPERLAFAAAAWMRYLRGSDEKGQAYALNDPLASRLQELARATAGDAAATVRALGTLPEIWGATLPKETAWLARVQRRLERIDAIGLLPALEEVEGTA